MSTKTTTCPTSAHAPTPAAPELLLPCPYCGEQEAGITLQLWDRQMTCGSCNTEFTPADVRSMLAKWLPVLDWVDSMPVPR